MTYLLKKMIVISGLLTVILVGTFGMMFIHRGGLVSNNSSSMCPFMSDSTVVCKMTPMEHIEKWQNMFTTLPAVDFLTVAIIFLFSLAFAFLHTRLKNIFDLLFLGANARSRLRYATISIPASPLQEAFSNGILNSKTF